MNAPANATKILLLAMLIIPCSALAEDSAQGGFPSGPIWLSKTSLTDGDNVQIFAALYDAGSTKINGDTVFLVDGTPIGSVHFELAGGEAKIASLSWNAKEGTHTVSAEIHNAADSDAKQALSLSKDKTEGIQVTVAAPPPQPAVVKILSAASNAITGVASASLPAVTAAANAIFTQTENLRTQAQTALQNSLAQTAAPQTATAPQVLGAETENLPASVTLAAAAKSPTGFSFLRLLQQILLFIVSSLWLFYPLLLFILLALFYVLAKTLSRRKPVRA